MVYAFSGYNGGVGNKKKKKIVCQTYFTPPINQSSDV